MQKQAEQSLKKPQQIVTETFQGPIPHPVILEQYNKATPGAADRIISMAENEATHRHEMEKLRHEMEKLNVLSGYKEASVGQIFALIIGVVAIISGATVAVLGYPIPGAIIGSAAVVGLVTVFIRGRK